MIYTITIREHSGQLMITIPVAKRRTFGLRAGDSVRFRKQRAQNAIFISFYRSGRKIVRQMR